MNNKELEKLVGKNILKYEYKNVGEDEDKPDVRSNFRNRQKLVLTFFDGTELELQTFCSGSSEDTVLIIDTKETQTSKNLSYATIASDLKHLKEKFKKIEGTMDECENCGDLVNIDDLFYDDDNFLICEDCTEAQEDDEDE